MREGEESEPEGGGGGANRQKGHQRETMESERRMWIHDEEGMYDILLPTLWRWVGG